VIDQVTFKPKTVYVTYIASTPDRVWQALTDAQYIAQYFFGREPAGEAVKLTVTESYSWDVPDALLSGGRSGWPAILSGLKSVLETGKPVAIDMEPPQEMMAAVRQAVAAKPWLKS
jgi:hypothetical protein